LIFSLNDFNLFQKPKTEDQKPKQMTLIKICGITNLEDALASIEAGADALGFNFYRRSPRYIEPECAREIIEQLPYSIFNVGVFVNEKTPDDVARIADKAMLDAVQLHGEESPEYCHALRERNVIKALRVGPVFKAEDVLKFETDAILLDSYSRDAHGGTGKIFDWTLAAEVQKLASKLFLAGGLTPENVSEAILQVSPFAVDVCSNLESSLGKKDVSRVTAFIKTVREAETKSNN
jgi:phosphoribosylanthranilate isomerase